MCGEILSARQFLPEIRKVTRKKVSLGYVYRLLYWHGWCKLSPRPRHVKANREQQQEFKEIPVVVKKVLAEVSQEMRLRVLFQDESRLGRISERRRCWGRSP